MTRSSARRRALPGASSAEIIRRSKGDLAEMPGTADNPLWRRTSWWIEWPTFVQEQGREPASLEEFVAWSQARQAEALRIAAIRLRRPILPALRWFHHMDGARQLSVHREARRLWISMGRRSRRRWRSEKYFMTARFM